MQLQRQNLLLLSLIIFIDFVSHLSQQRVELLKYIFKNILVT